MKYIRRVLYLFYYLKETDFRKIGKFVRYAQRQTGKSVIRISTDVFYSAVIYNVSFKDYFCFRFYDLSKEERMKWAGTGFMYEYQLKMNPPNAREVLENKILFLHHFRKFVNRRFYSIDELRIDQEALKSLLVNPTGKLVLKGSRGQVGAEVRVIECNDFTHEGIISYMIKNKLDLAEEYVQQHDSLKELSPSGLNTVRIFTQLENGKTVIVGARLRVSVNSPVDNMAAGNLAAPVDIETGVIYGPAVYSDITLKDETIHPVTGKNITGFHVPFWKEVIGLAKNAAQMTPSNRSVGWDIAVTETGPELIEGNHNWCKLLWQMPVKQGLKAELEKYL